MNENKLTVIMYHYVRDLKNSRYPGIKGLQTELFKEQIGYLKKHYTFVSAEEVMAAYAGEYKLPEHPVLLTFDDAYADHFNTVFPILKHEGIKGAFYAPVKAITENRVLDVNKIHFILASTPESKMQMLLEEIRLLLQEYKEEYHLANFDIYFNKLAVASRFDTKEVIFVKRLLQVELDEQLRNKMADILFEKVVGVPEHVFSRELYMSIDQIRCMADCGMHIGSHGYDHYWLGSLPKEKQDFEIKKSIEFISSVGGDIDNWSLCYPYGNYNEETISLLKENNCKLALTTMVDLADWQMGGAVNDAVYKLPRLDTNDIPKDSAAATNKWY